MKEVFGDWARCMKSKSYPGYSTPLDILAASKWGDLTQGSPSAEEVRTATADIDCKETTKLIERAFRIQSEHEQALIDEQRRELDENRAQWVAIVDRAETVLGALL